MIRNEDFLFRLLFGQKSISKGNIESLQKLVESGHPRLVEKAKVLLEIAEVKPHKRRRLKFLWQNHRRLLEDLFRVGLLYRDILFEDDGFSSMFQENGVTEDGESFPGEEWEDPEYWASRTPAT